MKTVISGASKAERPVSRQVLFIVLGTAFVLSVPLLAMMFSAEVNWGPLDFAVAGALLVTTGVTYVLLAKMVSHARFRIVLAVVLAAALFIVWAELAVGILGTPFAGT